MPQPRHALPRFAGLLLATCLTLPALAAEDPDVRSLMTPEEFRAAGLGKLSPAEIEALNRWVVRYTAGEAPVMRAHSEVVREEIKRTDSAVTRTRIVGEFRGWYGDTVFRLENGQTWKQRLSGKWYHRADSPEVELSRNMMGYWVLRVVSEDRSVGVVRVD
ncbi:MAG: hypothetical protein ACKPE6_03410 [Gammaproteobacteria bacterium]